MSEHYDELRAHVASEVARTDSGLMKMILARLDADTAKIASLAHKVADAEANAERYAQTIEWNRGQYEREAAEARRRAFEWDCKRQEAAEGGLAVARRLRDAQRAGRKTVRIADILGEVSA